MLQILIRNIIVALKFTEDRSRFMKHQNETYMGKFFLNEAEVYVKLNVSVFVVTEF